MAKQYRHKWGQEEDDRCRTPEPMGNPADYPGAMIVCRWCGHELVKHGQKVSK